MSRRYVAVIERGRRNYSAYVPDVPGCVATSRSVPGVLRELGRALGWHFESLRQHGEAVPLPHPDAAAEAVRTLAASDMLTFVEVEEPVVVS